MRVQLADLGLKPDQIEQVRRGMWKVVNDQGGTATHAKIKGVEVAGKTGTAEFWRNGVKDNHTWFICFAPYQKPKYAICVFLQGAKGGGDHGRADCRAHPGRDALLDAGTYNPEVKKLDPAKGNFTFINNVDFTSSVPVTTGRTPAPRTSPRSRATSAAAQRRARATDDGDEKKQRPRPRQADASKLREQGSRPPERHRQAQGA